MTETIDTEGLLRSDDFEQAAFEELDLEELDLEERSLEDKSFSHCTFTRVRLPRGSLRECRFDDCTFVACDLSMVRLDGTALRTVVFQGCRLLGIDWTAARRLSFDVRMEDCAVSYGVFVEMKLRGMKMINCQAHELNLTDADLRDDCFSGTDLRGTHFENTCLVGADLERAKEYLLDPRRNRLGETRLSLEGALASLELLGIRVFETP